MRLIAVELMERSLDGEVCCAANKVPEFDDDSRWRPGAARAGRQLGARAVPAVLVALESEGVKVARRPSS